MAILAFRVVCGSFTKSLRYGQFLYLLLNKLFDGVETSLVFRSHECDGASLVACSCGTPDAVHIIFAIVWYIKVYDEGDVVDVDTS
jgi:hypothetical protein